MQAVSDLGLTVPAGALDLEVRAMVARKAAGGSPVGPI